MRGMIGTLELVQLVGEAVGGDGQQAGIGEQDLREGQRGRIAVVGGLHIGDEQLAHRGQRVQEGLEDAVRLVVEIVDLGRVGAFDAGGLADPAVGQGAADLAVEQAPGFAQPPDQKDAQFRGIHRGGALILPGNITSSRTRSASTVLRGVGAWRQQGVRRIDLDVVEQPRQIAGGLADFRLGRPHGARTMVFHGFLFHRQVIMAEVGIAIRCDGQRVGSDAGARIT